MIVVLRHFVFVGHPNEHVSAVYGGRTYHEEARKENQKGSFIIHCKIKLK